MKNYLNLQKIPVVEHPSSRIYSLRDKKLTMGQVIS